MKVYFYYERNTGRGLRGKRSRKYERQGFNRCRIVELTRKPQDADVIFTRNIPEKTNDELLQKMQSSLADWQGIRVLNHPRSMLLSDSKDRTFDAWKRIGLQIPEHVASPTKEDLRELAQSYQRLICRVNNLACGDQTLFLDNPGLPELEKARQAVTEHADVLRACGRGDTRPMAVEFVDSTDKFGFLRSLRVFTVGSSVFGGAVLISRVPIVNLGKSCCSSPEEVDSFLYNCSLLDSLIEDMSFCRMAVSSVQVLGLDVGCIDFVIRGDEIILLEANSLWSPSFKWAGGRPGQKAFKANREHWQKAAKAYCRWMDRAEFYHDMYDAFLQFEQVDRVGECN